MSINNRFGTFFRTTRKALGLNLREFCRRNGFDPGNISRLERGLSPPPQAQQGLEAFAKALKLKRKTERWERFFELAAAATKRIPSELLEEHKTDAQLASLFRQLRGGQGHSNWVKAHHLEDWADILPARSMLPQLVRRLVHATGRGVTYRKFPAGEEVQRPGWDGVVEATGSDEFVPQGTSVWEMGVNENPREKAEEDFKKRTKSTRVSERKERVFVFVTPRKWQTAEEWVNAKKKRGTWKDVRVYDSASLEEWLERAAAVDTWLARILGIRHDGLTDIDDYWENLAAVTEPSFTPEVFLASRDKEVERLKKWLEGPPDALMIETRSPTEAVDFVAAFSRSPSAGDAFTAHAVLVESREAWRAMAASGSKLVLIAHPILAVEPELVAEAVRQGQHAILCSERSADRVSKLQLTRVYRYDLQKALASSGLEHSKAADYAKKAGGSLTVLKRLLGRYLGTTQPEWSRQPAAASLVPLLLAGHWEETAEGDRLVLERLSARPYHDLSSVANQWLHTADPLVTQVL
ncbi:MAG TPA: helix-turn-helix domain-containing protein, partial [Gemmataceae bacterium]|nr:helix-turn-helix domain-containing protein [Gemmataceae bacterium]